MSVKVQALDEQEMGRLIDENHFPATILEVGLVWVKVDLSDAVTGIARTEVMSKSDFADLILDWRARGCHLMPACSGLSVQRVADSAR